MDFAMLRKKMDNAFKAWRNSIDFNEFFDRLGVNSDIIMGYHYELIHDGREDPYCYNEPAPMKFRLVIDTNLPMIMNMDNKKKLEHILFAYFDHKTSFDIKVNPLSSIIIVKKPKPKKPKEK